MKTERIAQHDDDGTEGEGGAFPPVYPLFPDAPLGAIDYLIAQRVIDDSAARPGALDALEKLTEREKDWPGLAEVLERRANESSDDETRANVLMKLGAVYGERLEDNAKSIATWRRVLEVKPGQPKALRVLREAYTAAGDWDALEAMYSDSNDFEGLVDVLGTAADRAEDPATKVALSFRAAGIYEQKLNQPARAFRSYERVLSVEPKNARAASALVPIYQGDEKWARLASMYEVLLDTTASDDKARSLELLEKLRELSATKLHDRPAAFRWALRAIDGYRDALDIDRAEATSRASLETLLGDGQGEGVPVAAARALSPVYESEARWDSLVRVLDRIATDTDDEDERRRSLTRAAEVCDLELRAPDRAFHYTARELRLSLSDGEVSSKLESLERLSRAANLHADHVRTLKEIAPDLGDADLQLSSFMRVAELSRDALKDSAGAREYFEKALELRPDHGPALDSLESLHEATGSSEALLQVLRSKTDLAADDSQRRALLHKQARVSEEKLNDRSAAARSYESVLEMGFDRDAATALERIYEAEQRWNDLSSLYESQLSQPGADEVSLYHRLGVVAATAQAEARDEVAVLNSWAYNQVEVMG